MSDMERNIIVIKKERKTPNKYPRKAGTPSKEPLK
jgi:16S rRNA (guanine527-N7)-methyltransferase